MTLGRQAGIRSVLLGIVGGLVGSAFETLLNRATGRSVVTDGLLWGAVLGVLVSSLSSFPRMGSLVVKNASPPIAFLVGVGLFLVISAALVLVFLAAVFVIGHFIS